MARRTAAARPARADELLGLPPARRLRPGRAAARRPRRWPRRASTWWPPPATPDRSAGRCRTRPRLYPDVLTVGAVEPNGARGVLLQPRPGARRRRQARPGRARGGRGLGDAGRRLRRAQRHLDGHAAGGGCGGADVVGQPGPDRRRRRHHGDPPFDRTTGEGGGQRVRRTVAHWSAPAWSTPRRPSRQPSTAEPRAVTERTGPTGSRGRRSGGSLRRAGARPRPPAPGRRAGPAGSPPCR